MTGYGKAEVQIQGSTCTIEARCVNGRYLELSSKLPREWSDKEAQIRETVREHVTRGSLSITIRKSDAAQLLDIGPNLNVASAYVQALSSIQRELSLPGDIRIEHIAMLPGLFQTDGQKSLMPMYGLICRQALSKRCMPSMLCATRRGPN